MTAETDSLIDCYITSRQLPESPDESQSSTALIQQKNMILSIRHQAISIGGHNYSMSILILHSIVLIIIQEISAMTKALLLYLMISTKNTLLAKSIAQSRLKYVLAN